MRVGIIDYGSGNIGSVLQTLRELRVAPSLISHPDDLMVMDRLILPGVGNFADCAYLLKSGNWTESLREAVLKHKRPLLGICVGMQLLADSSTENYYQSEQSVDGFGFIPGKVVHLKSLGCQLRIPHVGWNNIIFHERKAPLLIGIPENTDFYFVHSYTFVPEDATNLIATVDYGIRISAIVRKKHIWGTQFHPEKSSRAGLQILKNFIEEAEC